MKRPSQETLARVASFLHSKRDKEGQPEHVSLAELDYHGVAMLAFRAGYLPEELANDLKQRRAMVVATESMKHAALNELAEALNDENLRPLIFKGTALAYTVYPEPWLRPRTDTDLFIDKQQLPRLQEVLQRLGFEKLFAIEGDLVSYQSTFGKRLNRQIALNLDVHWRINNRQMLANTFSYAELLGRARHLKSLQFSVISQADALLVACLHRLGHHQREERLAWLYDIYLLGSSLNESDWQLVQELAIEKNISALTLDGLQQAMRYFGLAIPVPVLASLQASSNESSAIFLRRDLPEWRIFVAELKALSNTRLRVQWITETLFPRNDYVRQQMNQKSAVVAHLLRLSRGLQRVFRHS